MKLSKPLRWLYTECLNCKLTRKQCPKGWKDRRKGIIPRAFDFSLSPRPKLLIVGKNPGHPVDRFRERQFYIGRTGGNLFKSYLKWREHFLTTVLASKDNSLRYHKNRNRYLRFILGHSGRLETYDEYSRRVVDSKVAAKDHTRVMRSIAMTNLFKCSTRDEQERLNASDVSTCYNRFFMKEVALWHPRAILAFGNEVHNILRKLDTDRRLPPIVAIRHPSYFYAKQAEAKELRRLKKNLTKYF